MLRLSGLFHEIHRRGLWQAAAAFLGMGWAVLEVMDLFTSRGLLPDWTFMGALVVLALGLPVVMATAFVQTPEKRRVASESDGSEAPLATDAGVSNRDIQPFPDLEIPPVEPARRPRALRGFLTWKRALLGGVFAFALLGISAATFGLMRVTGIGSPGTLLAQGVIEEGGLVILADFQSTVESEAPSDLVTEALRIDLEQSPTFDLMNPRAVSAGLARMVRDPDEPFSEDVALELAAREGAEVVVGGDIGAVGGGFLLTGRILAAQDGSVLASFRETARDSTELLDIIDALSAKVRSKMGEALRSVASSDPLYEGTTSSLEALRKYTFVAQREPRGAIGGLRAQQILREAVALDTTFAEAYRYLSILVTNHGGSVQMGADAAARAFRHRERLSPKKQLLVQANYHLQVTGDYPQAARAYRGLLELDSLDSTSAVNLADVAMYEGEYQEAEELLRRVPRPEHLVWSWNLMASLSGQKKYAEAEELLDQTRLAQPENVYLPATRGLFFAASGQPEKALAELDAAPTPPDEVAAWFAYIKAVAQAQAGRLELARENLNRTFELQRDYGTPADQISAVGSVSVLVGWVGEDADRGKEALDALIQDLPLGDFDPIDRAYGSAALLYAMIGASSEAQEFVDLYRTEVPSEGNPFGRSYAAVAEAMVKLLNGATLEASEPGGGHGYHALQALPVLLPGPWLHSGWREAEGDRRLRSLSGRWVLRRRFV